MVELDPRQIDEGGIRERIQRKKEDNPHMSDTRRKFLQKYSRIMTGDDSVRLEFGGPARVNMDAGDPVIFIPVEEFEQPVTDYKDEIFMLMSQETLTVHEIGHILYTNFTSFKNYLNKLDQEDKPIFKHIWNAAEDGAIEEELRRSFNVANEIEVMNSNFSAQVTFGSEQSNGDIIYTMFEAVTAAVMDLAVYDSGEFRNIMQRGFDSSYRLSTPDDQKAFEEFVPRIKKFVMNHLTESDAKKRNKLVYEFFLDCQDLFDKAQIDGTKLQERGGENGSGRGHAHPVVMRPDDSEGHTGGERRYAVGLGSGDHQQELDERLEIIETGELSDSDREEGREDNGDDILGDDEGDYEHPSGYQGVLNRDENEGAESEEAKERLEEKFKDELKSEFRQSSDRSRESIEQEIQEAKRFLELVEENMEGGETGGPGADDFTLELAEGSGEENRTTLNQAKQHAERLKQVLRARLQAEKETRDQNNQTRGSFDERRMPAASRGSPRVFKQEVEEDEKDYDAIVVLDRSGSMSGSRISDSEVAMGMLVSALQDIGVNTCIMDLYGGRPRISLPFGVPLEDKTDTVFTNEASGGTPLNKALYLARERVEMQDSNPFMIVITDGKPHDPGAYERELQKTNFPVIGIYMNTGESADAVKGFFDHVKNVTGDEMTVEIRYLIQQIMF